MSIKITHIDYMYICCGTSWWLHVNHKRAVVIGGGIAGLCATRVLRDHFDEVVLVERDSSFADGDRRGTPQAKHHHLLLARGLRELDRLFPGFAARLTELGAVELDLGVDLAVARPEGWVPRVRTGIRTLHASRALVERVVADMLKRWNNIRFRFDTDVVGLRVSGGVAQTVSGVRVRACDRAADEVIDADLVVDTTGRSSRLHQWLAPFGKAPPPETVVDPKIGYVSGWFETKSEAQWPKEWWWRAVTVGPMTIECPYAAALFPQENGTWVATLAYGDRPAPRGEATFFSILRSLRSPLVAEMLERTRPISGWHGFQQMPNRLRHFEKWRSPLGGLVVTGDAVCTFNPIYGQGMTVAVLMALNLGAQLERTDVHHPAFSRRFFAAQAEVLSDAWRLATGADFQLPWTVGKRPLGDSVISRYTEALLLASKRELPLRPLLFEVFHLLRPLSSLEQPAVVARVLRQQIVKQIVRAPKGAAYPPLPSA